MGTTMIPFEWAYVLGVFVTFWCGFVGGLIDARRRAWYRGSLGDWFHIASVAALLAMVWLVSIPIIALWFLCTRGDRGNGTLG